MSTNDPMTQEQLNAIQARLNAVEADPPEEYWSDGAGIAWVRFCEHARNDIPALLAEVERLRPRAALADAMIERVARDTAAKEAFTSRRQWEDLPDDERTYLRAHAHCVLAANLTPQEEA